MRTFSDRGADPPSRPLSGYDFQDAAVTCIEKDAVPVRRDVRRLCEIMLGGDRIGQVGYRFADELGARVALLWSARHHLGDMTRAELRERCADHHAPKGRG